MYCNPTFLYILFFCPGRHPQHRHIFTINICLDTIKDICLVKPAQKCYTLFNLTHSLFKGVGDMNENIRRIRDLKEKKNAVIMAHYYVDDQVQELADFVGDSYYLSETAAETDADIIILCGVSFMGESAKILSPGKKVIVPEPEADCPMAHMADAERIKKIREKYDDIAVVCYVNSTAELKAASDVCVTSSNALKIVKALPNKNIYFIPDQNLAHFIADMLPEKNFIFNDGYCYVHHNVSASDINTEKAIHPDALVLVHPESKPEVTALADYVGSTSGIIDYATRSSCREFIIITEAGVLHELKKRNPHKKFFTAGNMQICSDMKKITVDSVLKALENEYPEVTMDEYLINEAHRPMKQMLDLSK